MGRKKRQAKSPADWENLPEEELLSMRVRDLGLTIEGSPLEAHIQRLYDELDAQGIRFHPPCYLADEWLCPDRVPMIGIAFYLAHRRLSQLEKKMMLEVEGGTDRECMMLLRHEAGHALNYAYLLFKKTRWRELFGPFSATYTESYKSLPYSKRYVSHLRDNYAQAHPDEDWAETFAVWLNPEGNWSVKYRDWPAIAKLKYVDHVMKRVGSQPPPATTRETPWSAARMTSTLSAYYERRRRYMGEDFPGFYDPGLQRIFPVGIESPTGERASVFIRRCRRQVTNSVAVWTGRRKYDIDKLLRKLIKRCNALKLTVSRDAVETATNLTAYVTAVITKVCRSHEDMKGK